VVFSRWFSKIGVREREERHTSIPVSNVKVDLVRCEVYDGLLMSVMSVRTKFSLNSAERGKMERNARNGHKVAGRGLRPIDRDADKSLRILDECWRIVIGIVGVEVPDDDVVAEGVHCLQASAATLDVWWAHVRSVLPVSTSVGRGTGRAGRCTGICRLRWELAGYSINDRGGRGLSY
jgi:hypothetical protein